MGPMSVASYNDCKSAKNLCLITDEIKGGPGGQTTANVMPHKASVDSYKKLTKTRRERQRERKPGTVRAAMAASRRCAAASAVAARTSL